MKFLIHSNSPNIPTGYGMQVAALALRLQADGHDVAISSTYGQQGEIGTWRGIRVYPNGWAEQSVDALPQHALHWFGGDYRGGWIIILTDVWGVRCPVLTQFNVIGWAPVDHDPISPMIIDWFRRTCAHPISMSQFGDRCFEAANLPATYIPLTTDTTVYKPTPTVKVGDTTTDARTFFDLPHEAFVVGMVAMNKDPNDRKGFNEAFRAFAQFQQSHPNAVMFCHTEPHGIMGSGIDLYDLAAQAGITPRDLYFTDAYAYRLGFSRELMAAAYTAMDVLLAPSRGEGFCVPLIEAQACGVPVIASNFTAQPELVGPASGWLVDGQIEYDPTHRSNFFRPFISSIVDALEQAFAADLTAIEPEAIAWAKQWDSDLIFDTCWRPFLATLEPPVVVKPKMERLNILVPLIRNQENRTRLSNSLVATRGDAEASYRYGEEGKTFAENVNALYAEAIETHGDRCDWVLVVGDDCEFTPGWFEAIQELSDRFDVIGTNDSEAGRIRNPDVAAGRHADHFAVRRSYIDELGACLDGPGVLAPECYGHWYTDKEIIQLARARGVYGHAHEARIIHHHPGYDGDEAAREADPVYMKAVASSEADRRTFMQRAPLIENHRVMPTGPMIR